MPESPHLEFWKDIKPIEKVFKDGGLPEVYASKIAEGDPRYWVPISATVSSKPVWISPAKNMWADVLMSSGPGLVSRRPRSAHGRGRSSRCCRCCPARRRVG